MDLQETAVKQTGLQTPGTEEPQGSDVPRETSPAETGTPAPVTEPDETVTLEGIMADPVAKAKAGTPKWAQRRFDELTARIREKEKRIEELETARVPVERPVPPRPDQFDTDADYQNAMVGWKDADDAWKVKLATSQRQNEEFEERQNQNAQKYVISSERMREKYADFDTAIDATRFGYLASIVLESDLAPEIGYFLAKNPDKLMRMRSLPPHVAAMEIGKMEATLQGVRKKTSTNAPPPIPPLEGSTPPIKEITADSPIEDWMANERAKRMEKIKQKYKGP